MSPRDPDPIAAAILAQVPYLRAAVRRRGVPDGDVDGLVSEVMFAAWKAATDKRINAHDVSELRRWCNVVAKRCAINHAKAATRRAQLEANKLIGPASSTEDRMAARDALRVIHRLLSPDERALFDAIAEGVSLVEVAAKLGLAYGTAASRVLRARERLRGVLERTSPLGPTPLRICYSEPGDTRTPCGVPLWGYAQTDSPMADYRIVRGNGGGSLIAADLALVNCRYCLRVLTEK